VPSAGVRDVNNADDLAVSVALYDYVHGASALEFAENIAADVFRAAGVRLQWVNPCSDPIVPSAYVGVLSNDMANNAPVTGFALGSASPLSMRAYVFFDRISAHALTHHMHPNKFLGFVIAHELGHIMLQRHGHSTAGIMSDHLELELVRMKALAFVESDARSLREYARVHGTAPSGKQPSLAARR
jgi:hypothetical protein